MNLRLSLINFVNALPLQWGFMRGGFPESFDIAYDLPSRCADRLSEGDADVGLIPAVEYQRIEGLRIIPGMAIASKKQVKSVLFVSKKPIQQVQTVALDTSSRTSAVLTRLLLRRKFFLRPEYRAGEPDLPGMLEHNDSALIIGNPALLVERDRYYVFDLVEQWVEMTGKPFVFAFWAARDAAPVEPLLHRFVESKAHGLSHLEEIADYAVTHLPVSRPVILDYLEEKLNYDLDVDNLAGLELFYQLAAGEGLLPPPRALHFVQGAGKTATGS